MDPLKARTIAKTIFWLGCVILSGLLVVIVLALQIESVESIAWLIDRFGFLAPTYAIVAIAGLVFYLVFRLKGTKRYAFSHIGIVAIVLLLWVVHRMS